MENEEKGTNKQLTMCQTGPGGIALVTGLRRADQAGGITATTAKAAPSTQLDVGLALDLIDVVNANPSDPGAPTALNNACVIYEKLFQFGEATKCYERLYGSYPDSEWGKEALWNASRNHYRFFEFDQAVKGYLTVAQDPKFAQSEHRKEALGLAASMLDNDQQYARAADLYKKYSDAVADKPQDSAQAYFFACNAYEKANDIRALQRLPQGLHQALRQAAGGGRVRRAGVHEAGRDHRARQQEQDRGARRLQARARRVHRAQAAARDAGRRLRGQGRLHDHGGEVQGLSEEGAEVRQQARPGQEDVRRVRRRGEGAQRGLPEDLGLQGRDLDAGVVPPLGRRLLRVRAEADQGGRRAARRAQEAGEAGVQAEPR